MREELIERFLRYSAIASQSQAGRSVVPTSQGQWDLAYLIADELEQVGATEIHVSDHACVTARVPGAAQGPTIGLCAHLDTADVGLSAHVSPQLVRYDGGVVELGHGKVLDPTHYPALAQFVGEEIFVTDGSSVLGADDKAGVAAILTALNAIQDQPHADIVIAFVPDEEIGLRGAKALDLARFPVDVAYTVDGEGLGEISYETFNAAYAHVAITGVPAHPISAKGVLVNPNLVAHDLISRFDRTQTPECTEGREGYIWVQEVQGNQATASVTLNIRDHDREKFQAKKDLIERYVQETRGDHPRAQIECTITDVYGNIADAVTPDNRWAVEHLERAVRAVGLEPLATVMRGGTDGSYLSSQGILTPNVFTGGFNFHSVQEFLPVSALVKSCEVVTELVTAEIPRPGDRADT